MILFNSILLLFEKINLSTLLYVFDVFSLPKILISINVLLNIDVFSLYSINYYIKPFIRLMLILYNITVRPDICLFFIYFKTGLKIIIGFKFFSQGGTVVPCPFFSIVVALLRSYRPVFPGGWWFCGDEC